MTSQTSLDPNAIVTIGTVASRTISEFFNTGRRKSIRIPWSRFRRVPHEVLREYLKSRGVQLGDLEQAEELVSDTNSPFDVGGSDDPVAWQLPETLSPFVVGEPVVLALDATIVASMLEKLLLGELVQPISVLTTTEFGHGTAFFMLFESGAISSVSVQQGQSPQTIEFPDPLELIDPLRDEPLEGAYQVTLIQLIRPEDRVHAA